MIVSNILLLSEHLNTIWSPSYCTPSHTAHPHILHILGTYSLVPWGLHPSFYCLLVVKSHGRPESHLAHTKATYMCKAHAVRAYLSLPNMDSFLLRVPSLHPRPKTMQPPYRLLSVPGCYTWSTC